jgi:hypothetical protein
VNCDYFSRFKASGWRDFHSWREIMDLKTKKNSNSNKVEKESSMLSH